MTTIGFVGLGAMGSRIAGRLLDGHRVYGTNRTPAAADALVKRGLIWRPTPREVAEAADVIFSMVTDDAALEDITSGPDGILAGLAPGKIYIDMSTISPRASRAIGYRVHCLGATMLDAPVSGSVPAAQDGSLMVLVGGPAEAFRAVEPLLHWVGSVVTHVGGQGQALVLKLAINISLAAQMLAFSEGVLLAERGGIDPRVAVTAMAASSIGSPMLKARAPLVLDPPARAWFDMHLMHKDIHLALEAGRELQVPLPSAAVSDAELTRAEELGYGQRDIVALVETLARGRAAS
jgi:3-hydroxyisobutyrate dehydrogenase-like beta-hydroxyacid dehydrogenase